MIDNFIIIIHSSLYSELKKIVSFFITLWNNQILFVISIDEVINRNKYVCTVLKLSR